MSNEQSKTHRKSSVHKGTTIKKRLKDISASVSVSGHRFGTLWACPDSVGMFDTKFSRWDAYDQCESGLLPSHRQDRAR